MIRGLIRLSKDKTTILAFLITFFYLISIVFIKVPLSQGQAESAVVLRSLFTYLDPEARSSFFSWLSGSVVRIFPLSVIPNLSLYFFSSEIVLRMTNLVLMVILFRIFYRLGRFLFKEDNFLFWSSLVFFFSPWTWEIFFFYPDFFCLLILFLIALLNIYEKSYLSLKLVFVLFCLFLLHPLGAFFSLVLLLFYIFKNLSVGKSLSFISLLLLFSLGFWFCKLQKMPFFEGKNILAQISPQRISYELQYRFQDEDSLKEKIIFPLKFRRLGSNKLTFTLQKILRNPIELLDVNRFFFQEISWKGIKQVPVFFWWTIVPFIYAIISFAEFTPGLKKFLFFCFTISFCLAGFFPGLPFSEKAGLLVLAISLVVGWGLAKAIRTKKRFFMATLVVFLISAFLIYHDFYRRPFHWFDNRWFIADSIGKWLNENSETLSEQKEVKVTTVTGPTFWWAFIANRYDPNQFWLKYHPDYFSYENVLFKGFNLKEEKQPFLPSLYIGFEGEFVGSNRDNNFSNYNLPWRGEIVNQLETYDSISWGNGNRILFVQFKDFKKNGQP